MILTLVLGISLIYAVYVFLRENGMLTKENVKGKHIFITGAGSGIGRGMTLKFAAAGANLTMCDINMEGLEETKRLVKELTKKDDNLNLLKLDVSDRKAISDSKVKAN